MSQKSKPYYKFPFKDLKHTRVIFIFTVTIEAPSSRKRRNHSWKPSQPKYPLAGITGAGNTLLSNHNELEESTMKDLLNSIHDEATWLSHMVENISSLTRVQSAGGIIHKVPEVLDDILFSAVQRIRTLLEEHELEVLPSPEVVLVPMEGTLIEQGTTVYRIESLTVDLEKRIVLVNNQEVHVTPTEFKLLSVMVRHPGITLVLTGWGLIRRGKKIHDFRALTVGQACGAIVTAWLVSSHLSILPIMSLSDLDITRSVYESVSGCTAATTLILTCRGMGLNESLFETISALGNNGLSTGSVSAESSSPVLWTQTTAMILGRFEFYILFLGIAQLFKRKL